MKDPAMASSSQSPLDPDGCIRPAYNLSLLNTTAHQQSATKAHEEPTVSQIQGFWT
jgi:hypothetical protein